MSSIKEEEPKIIEATKIAYRKHVWQTLESKRFANFPHPIFGRIPNFKGSDEAASKLLQLEEFNAAVNVEVNPDKAQESARMIVLQNKKELYVPVPRLTNGLLKHVKMEEDATKAEMRIAISRRGIEQKGVTIPLTETVPIDLFVMGSVAVSVDGYRIGKGRGYADLEFAMLQEMKAVSNKTVVVTIVHDLQVFDSFPIEMFKAYDVPVDYILTPTKIIKVSKPLPRPVGILWNVLSNRRLNLMPVLQELRAIDEKKGMDVELKGEDTDIESYEPKKHFTHKRFQRRRPRSEAYTSDSQGEDHKTDTKKRVARRFFKKRPRITSGKDQKENTGPDSANELGKGNTKSTNRLRRPFRRNKSQIDFSLMVSNIEKTVRVRDLKNALNERGVKPNEITWRGYKGFCYLHYAKPRALNKSEEPAKVAPVVDNVIEILQNLKISPDSPNILNVKVLEPISRIETTDVTAV